MPPKHVFIYDEYNQPWKITEEDSQWEEAFSAWQETATTSQEGKVVWPISKLTQGRGYGWWSVYKKIDEFEEDLARMIPNPGHQRLIDINIQYTPTELSDKLQQFGSYLASLHHIEGIVEAQCHALKEGLKTGLQVALSQEASKTSIRGKEGKIIAGNELFKQTRRMQIDQEACLIVVKAWRESYEAAYATISRLVTLMVGEATLQTGRHP